MVNNWLLVNHKNPTRIYTIKPMKSKESAVGRKNEEPLEMHPAAL
jgi:hypothetical protein